MLPLKIVIACGCALALAACQQPAQQPPAGGDTSNAAPPTAATAATAPNSLWNDGQVKPLDFQVAHPNGVVLQVTSLQSRATETVVGIRVINGRQSESMLNRFPSSRDGYILLDSGERLYLSPPPTNAQLTIPAGQTFQGELVFVGRLPTARAAVLVLNGGDDNDNKHTSSPSYRIDLPLTGQAAAPAPAPAAPPPVTATGAAQ